VAFVIGSPIGQRQARPDPRQVVHETAAGHLVALEPRQPRILKQHQRQNVLHTGRKSRFGSKPAFAGDTPQCGRDKLIAANCMGLAGRRVDPACAISVKRRSTCVDPVPCAAPDRLGTDRVGRGANIPTSASGANRLAGVAAAGALPAPGNNEFNSARTSTATRIKTTAQNRTISPIPSEITAGMAVNR